MINIDLVYEFCIPCQATMMDQKDGILEDINFFKTII